MRILMIILKFLCFHVLSVVMTAVLASVLLDLLSRYNGMAAPSLGSSIHFGFDIAPMFIAILLIPSALGWWIGGALLGAIGTRPALRPVLQGALAGLAANIGMGVMVFWVPTTLIGLPIGALVGWWVYDYLWPEPPADGSGRASS